MAQLAQNRRPDVLQKMLWNLIYADKAKLFVDKMLITPSTFYRWLNGTRYPSVENIRRINRAMKTKQFLGLDYNILPE